MAEPDRQIEVQLGHLCNNRCVFCVSGQLSEFKRAPQLPPAPLIAEIRDARAGGAQKITFLGGEPTIQRTFPELLQLAVDLDYPEIVIFTNGVMTPRASFRARVFEILDGLGADAARRVIWRFSLQGGDELHHDLTTMNPGAWQRIQASLAALHERGARLTANMCVVASNYASVAALADEAARYGFESLHLDMVRPRDAGDRSEAEFTAMLARYTDIAGPLRQLAAAVEAKLGAAFDLNIGNLPYCTAPDLAHRIHHDGQQTRTVAASGQGTTQILEDKYLDKRSDKVKLPGCASCVFDGACSGIFDRYLATFGDGEFQPVSGDVAWALPRGEALFAALAGDAAAAWAAAEGVKLGRVDDHAGSIDLALPVAAAPAGPGGGLRWNAVLQRRGAGARRGGFAVAAADRAEFELLGGWPGDAPAETLLAALDRLDRRLGGAGVADVGGAAAALTAAVRRQRAGQQAAQAAAAQQRALTQRLADALQRAALPGLRASGASRSDDGAWWTLRFAAARGGALEVDLALLPDEAGRVRPRLRHRAVDIDEKGLRAASAAIGQVLRPLIDGRDSAAARAAG